jgi:hypothetical protein
MAKLRTKAKAVLVFRLGSDLGFVVGLEVLFRGSLDLGLRFGIRLVLG